MWVDGKLVLDEWLHVTAPAHSSPVMLMAQAGAHMVLEYRQVRAPLLSQQAFS